MGTWGQSITLANSIIGVGILAMPFCFQQCGVLLATLILITMGLISRLCCHFLLKSALIARRRNFEFLAFHVFGPAGKLAVEVGIIGFLMGTCIAYFVVVGDLGPQIIAKMFNINQSDILRTSIMVIVSLVCVLPLGLLRNVDSLSNVSAATIGFYFCLVMKVIAEAASQLFADEWQSKMEMWRPAGVLQCVPIFSMALFCQTQLFEIFESLPTLSLEKMNVVTKNAINICTAVYFTLGIFGYIAFCSHEISGNILMSLSPTMASDVIKLGFVMSLAFSFPLIIFPCRASLYSFLYKKIHSAHHDHIINHSIPETTFRCITVAIVAVALFISLLIPNIELVLGLVGSTIGVVICVIFPAACFINVTYKNTNERVLAKGVLILGFIVLVLGTYANLQAAESQMDRYDDKITQERIDKIVEEFFNQNGHLEDKPLSNKKPGMLKTEEILKRENSIDSKIQPPNPVPPNSHSSEVQTIEEKKPPPKKFNSVENVVDKVSESHPKNLQQKINEPKLYKEDIINDKSVENTKEHVEVQFDKTKEKNDVKLQENIDLVKQKQLIETIKQHGEEQKELIKEQKEILDELKKTQKELQQNKKEIESVEAKKIAVESIQKIANMAIKSLSGVSEPPKDQKKEEKIEPLQVIAHEAVQEIAKKAVEAIEEIKEQKIEGEKRLNESPSNNIVVNNAVQNPQVIIPNVKPEASLSNLAPLNPPSAQIQNNHNSESVPVPELPRDLIQKSGVPQQINNNAQEQPNNISPVQVSNQNTNDNIVNDVSDQPAPILNHNQLVQNQQINQKANKEIQTNQEKVPSQNLNDAQINQKHEVDTKKENQVAQKQNVIETQQIQNQKVIEAQPIQNQNVAQKVDFHSPDEPQFSKLGENVQTAEMAKNVAENIPIPIAMNGKSHAQARQVENSNVNNEMRNEDQKKNVQNTLNNVEVGTKDKNNKVVNDALPIRQKRQVVDCTKYNSLAQEDKEICKTLVNVDTQNTVKLQNLNNEIDRKPADIFDSKVDLNEGLNRVPMELLHHSRSLKSFNEDKRR